MTLPCLPKKKRQSEAFFKKNKQLDIPFLQYQYLVMSVSCLNQSRASSDDTAIRQRATGNAETEQTMTNEKVKRRKKRKESKRLCNRCGDAIATGGGRGAWAIPEVCSVAPHCGKGGDYGKKQNRSCMVGP